MQNRRCDYLADIPLYQEAEGVLMLDRWQVISDLIRKHKWTKGAELGLFKGETFFYLLEKHPDLTMIGVDRWQRTKGPSPSNPDTGFGSYEHCPMEDYAKAIKTKAKKYGKRAIIHHEDTVAAAKRVDDLSLDFVFIDASHDTQSVIEDIYAWRPKIKPHGGLLGHDSHWPSVKRGLQIAFSHGEWIDYFDAYIWFVKV